ncbi:MAG: hypothetical protein K0Q97_2915, partial [Bacillota bacterium]|nr:hypothetical protein [Bacillota bacterium]
MLILIIYNAIIKRGDNMCGRYYIDIDEKEFKEIINAAEKNIYKDYKSGEIFPSNIAPIYIHDEKNMRPILAKWGFPKWDKKGLIINAKAETLAEKQMFKKLILSNRCTIPASAYYEWKESSQNNKIKDKYIIKKPNSNLYFAGLYNIVPKQKSEQMSMFETDENDTDIFYTIITKDANSSVSHIHHRMPLIFD